MLGRLRHPVIGQFSSVQSLSRVRLFATPWTAHTRPPVHRQLPEFTQTHVHWVGDAIQPSHPLSSPSPPTFNLSQYQGLFQWVSSSHQVAKVLGLSFSFQYWVSASISVLPMNTQDWSPLGWTGWISLQSMGLSRVFSNTTIQKHQFFGAQPSLRSTLTSIHTTGKTIALTRQTFVGKVMSLSLCNKVICVCNMCL